MFQCTLATKDGDNPRDGLAVSQGQMKVRAAQANGMATCIATAFGSACPVVRSPKRQGPVPKAMDELMRAGAKRSGDGPKEAVGSSVGAGSFFLTFFIKEPLVLRYCSASGKDKQIRVARARQALSPVSLRVHSNGIACESALNPRDDNASEPEGLDDSGGLNDSGGLDTGGLDETGGGAIPPFSGMEDLVSCATPAECTVSAEFLSRIQEEFHGFYSDDITLTMTAGGLLLDGIDPGDASEPLFDAFGVQNEDVVTMVNLHDMSSWNEVTDLLEDLENTIQWDVTVFRRSTQETLNYTIMLDFPVSQTVLENGEPNLEETDSIGCSCQTSTSSDEVPVGLGFMALSLMALRRRRTTG